MLMTDTDSPKAEESAASDASAWLTVAEAARHLDIDPTQVRRYAGRVKAEDRTPKGQVPLRIRLAALIAQRDVGGSGAKSNTKETGQAAGHPEGQQDRQDAGQGQDSTSLEGSLPAVIYQKLLADKNGEIEYLRGQLRLAQENLAREQLLRLNVSPEGGWLERVDHSAGHETGHTAGQGQDTTQDKGQDSSKDTQGSRQPWWAFLWKSR